ncbi:MAG: uroporphyrinogen-III C-methyltransferase, partial [Hoeflea sp.]|nr:uroporphyrinogen-III C-methyltransferase [Hoeflea sp.]
VENASRGDRRLFHGTLADLPGLEHRSELAGPVMVVIGDSVAGASFENSIPIAAGQPNVAPATRTQDA